MMTKLSQKKTNGQVGLINQTGGRKAATRKTEMELWALLYWGGHTPGQRRRTALFKMKPHPNKCDWIGRKEGTKTWNKISVSRIVAQWPNDRKPTNRDIRKTRELLPKL